MKPKHLNGLLALVWIGNVAVLGLIVGLFYWFYIPSGAQADAPNTAQLVPKKEASRTPRPSVTPIPPPTLRPTITLWPTPSPGPSVTPMPIMPSNVSVIGYSVENRPLEMYHFGNGAVKKLIVAGIHGGYEHNTVELAEALINYLHDHPERIPGDTTLYILKDLNPDGYARDKSPDGRANANNVDLNHNWPYNWQADWSRDGCFNLRTLTGGDSAGSEPETRALANFIMTNRPTALISYHSAALGIFPGGKPDFPPSISLAQAIAAVSTYPYPPINTHCDYTGNLTDWAANTQSIPAVDIELTNHQDTDFEQNLRVLQAFLDWRP
jgi:predicted deacylase